MSNVRVAAFHEATYVLAWDGHEQATSIMYMRSSLFLIAHWRIRPWLTQKQIYPMTPTTARNEPAASPARPTGLASDPEIGRTSETIMWEHVGKSAPRKLMFSKLRQDNRLRP